MKMHTDRHQEAKLLPPDTFLSRKNAFAACSGVARGGGLGVQTPPPIRIEAVSFTAVMSLLLNIITSL